MIEFKRTREDSTKATDFVLERLMCLICKFATNRRYLLIHCMI